jgi:predicted nucleic acid-binding protein
MPACTNYFETLKIAAIALKHDATLLARNLTDFGMVPDLRVEDWTVPPTS